MHLICRSATGFSTLIITGGVNTFGDIKRAFQTCCAWSRTGGQVVFADETMPDWLRETEFAKVLLNNNPLHSSPVPLQHITVEAPGTFRCIGFSTAPITC